MSVWPGLETFHHQGLSDVPVQRPKVMSPSHCQLNSAEQSPDILAPEGGPSEAMWLGWGGATTSDRECPKGAKPGRCWGDWDQLPAFRQILRMHTGALSREKEKVWISRRFLFSDPPPLVCMLTQVSGISPLMEVTLWGRKPQVDLWFPAGLLHLTQVRASVHMKFWKIIRAKCWVNIGSTRKECFLLCYLKSSNFYAFHFPLITYKMNFPLYTFFIGNFYSG